MAWTEREDYSNNALINTYSITLSAALFNFIGSAESWTEESLASGSWTETSSPDEDWSEE
jgi:hypothetical protein